MQPGLAAREKAVRWQEAKRMEPNDGPSWRERMAAPPPADADKFNGTGTAWRVVLKQRTRAVQITFCSQGHAATEGR